MTKRSTDNVTATQPTRDKSLAEQKIDFTSEGAAPLAISKSKADMANPLPAKKVTRTKATTKLKDV
jgi:hypothetical protein